jgi:hypothetical protein
MTKVNKDTLKMKTDRTGKREFQEIKKKKEDIVIVKTLILHLMQKF